MKGVCSKIFMIALMLSYSLTLWSQAPSKKDIYLEMAVRDDGYALITSVTNKSKQAITVIFQRKDGAVTTIPMNAEESLALTNMVCMKSYIPPSKDLHTPIILWERQTPSVPEADEISEEPNKLEFVDKSEQSSRIQTTTSRTKQNKNDNKTKADKLKDNKKNGIKVDVVISDFKDYLEDISSYAQSSIEAETETVNAHITALKNWKDKDEYVKEKRLNTYINTQREEINQLKENINKLAEDFLNTKYKGKTLADKASSEYEIKNILRERINTRIKNLDRLEEEIKTPAIDKINLTDLNWYINNWKLVAPVVGSILILFIIIGWIAKRNKRNRQRETLIKATSSTTQASSDIVVRRKTTSILRTQNVDDVTDNPEYLRIDCNDFCDSSAVRVMYIKNACIKDIYNMYAEDLRNPNNPKEDGCMVLGRWVYDKEDDDYYVTLEHIVQPGDDAIFSEYELNFGGKIKLKVAEKLRKLRRETNLQYDLTCWVHSHPGLGVFFSNSDSNVQEQLKHPTHPKILTAMVVDILTPKQDLGIFTYKRDATINSKADLKKLYSLEDMFKWAVESERNSFKPDDYFNISNTAKGQIEGGRDILLSNGAIIDMDMMITSQRIGLLGWVHGFEKRQGLKCKLVAMTTKDTDKMVDNELLGCFMIGSHCSIPTIKKAVANYMNKIKFVLVYTTNDGLLTAIPVNNGEVCTEDKYYGEQKYEDLKIWTRRKR